LSGGADRTSGTLTTTATDPLVVAHGRLPTTNPGAVRDPEIDPHLIRAHLATATATNRAGNRRPNRLDSHATLDDRPSVRMLSLRKLPVTAVEPETYAESMCPIRPAAQRLTGCGEALVVAATDREPRRTASLDKTRTPPAPLCLPRDWGRSGSLARHVAEQMEQVWRRPRLCRWVSNRLFPQGLTW